MTSPSAAGRCSIAANAGSISCLSLLCQEPDERRQKQLVAGQKTRYDGRCRDRTEPPEGVDPVVRFRNPLEGEVVVNDQVKGRVVFHNEELDDLAYFVPMGRPRTFLSAVVDDSHKSITHVIWGDVHPNYVPRQMNMLVALGVESPMYAYRVTRPIEIVD